MRALILAFSLLLPISSIAQQQFNMGVDGEHGDVFKKDVICFTYTAAVKALTEKYHEKKFFDEVNKDNGDEDDIWNIAIFGNKDTGTWSLIEYNEKQNFACFLAYGKRDLT